MNTLSDRNNHTIVCVKVHVYSREYLNVLNICLYISKRINEARIVAYEGLNVSIRNAYDLTKIILLCGEQTINVVWVWYGVILILKPKPQDSLTFFFLLFPLNPIPQFSKRTINKLHELHTQ